MTTHAQLLQALLRQDLQTFHDKAIRNVMPGVAYIPNWHVEVMIATINEMIHGDLRRVIINIQPRIGKSNLCSIILPMFLLMRDPATQIMCVSYSETLAVKFHNLSRILAKQPWYRNLNPALQFQASLGSGSGLKNTDTLLQTSMQGMRRAASFGGGLTGDGGNWMIFDDPNDMALISSEAHRKRINETFDSTLSTRLNNKEGRMLLVTQRGHVDDFTGHLLAKGGFKQLIIEGIASEDTQYELGKNRIYQRKKGELIHPGLLDIAQLDERKRDLGSAGFEAQFQQNPLPPEGNVFKKKWITEVETLPEFQYCLISGDIAGSLGRGDYTSFLVWGYSDPHWYLIAVYREQLEQPGVVSLYRKLDEKYEPDHTLIEKNGLGAGFVDTMNDLGFKYVEGITVTGDKVYRAEAITPLLERGEVVFYKRMHNRHVFMPEFLSFPAYPTDDMVDAFTLAMYWRHDFLRVANQHRRAKRSHMPQARRSGIELKITEFSRDDFTVRDNYFARTGRSVFDR